ncbi:hypothetical protein C8J56DRAFT_792298 [Mycena floridula]|nr:hypothetical protein C8J56DRAFT_792298 [Mycena floridula]
MTVLQQAPSESTKKKLSPRPLILSNPSMVAQHTPCTMHPKVLPAELATKLFCTMINESKNWKRNRWWINDRVVESPHRTSFYARRTDETWREAAQYWYNGRMTDTPPAFPGPMEEACSIIERIVDQEIRKRTRFPLEWAGDGENGLIWRANVAASNCYEGCKESVGFHADQQTYLGPYSTIASLSLGTTRLFSLREVIPTDEKEIRGAQTFNIPLSHNSLLIMHASCQEKFKHSVPPQRSIDIFRPTDAPIETSNCRINITFRFYRPDFEPSSIPRCQCDVPMILRADMKNRTDGKTDRYWWTCYAGAQNEGKGCNTWTLMSMEGRGPVFGDQKDKAEGPARVVDA